MDRTVTGRHFAIRKVRKIKKYRSVLLLIAIVSVGFFIVYVKAGEVPPPPIQVYYTITLDDFDINNGCYKAGDIEDTYYDDGDTYDIQCTRIGCTGHIDVDFEFSMPSDGIVTNFSFFFTLELLSGPQEIQSIFIDYYNYSPDTTLEDELEGDNNYFAGYDFEPRCFSNNTCSFSKQRGLDYNFYIKIDYFSLSYYVWE